MISRHIINELSQMSRRKRRLILCALIRLAPQLHKDEIEALEALEYGEPFPFNLQRENCHSVLLFIKELARNYIAGHACVRWEDLIQIIERYLQAHKVHDDRIADTIYHIYSQNNCLKLINESQNKFISANIKKLAEEFYYRRLSVGILRDALLDEGHEILVNHFNSEQHPIGCWAVDYLTGRG